MSARHSVSESAREALGDLYAADATGDLDGAAERCADVLIRRGYAPVTAVRVAFQLGAPFEVDTLPIAYLGGRRKTGLKWPFGYFGGTRRTRGQTPCDS